MNNENELIKSYIVSKATELINQGIPVTQEQLNRAINMFVGNGKSFAENKPEIDKLIAQHIENHKKRLTENKPNNDLESMLQEPPKQEAPLIIENNNAYVKKSNKGNNPFGFAKSQSLSTTLLITAFILMALIILFIIIK